MADTGCTLMLSTFLNATVQQNLKLKLFCNDVTPTRASVPGTFTEASGGGYAALTLTNNSWTPEANTPIDFVYAAQTFTFTGALTTNGTVYGYYITNNAGTTLVCAQLLNAPFTPANNGDNIGITPKLQMSGGTPA
jgi:hypothetical protein